MVNPFTEPYEPAQLGPDGQAYYCAVGLARLTAPAEREPVMLRSNPNVPLVVPAGAVITQLVVYIPQPIRLGIPKAAIAFMRSRQQNRVNPSVLVTSDQSGYIPKAYAVCDHLHPGAGYQTGRDESFVFQAFTDLGDSRGGGVGQLAKAQALIRRSDDDSSPCELLAAVYYSLAQPLFTP